MASIVVAVQTPTGITQNEYSVPDEALRVLVNQARFGFDKIRRTEGLTEYETKAARLAEDILYDFF